jgi:hypothetical protein
MMDANSGRNIPVKWSGSSNKKVAGHPPVSFQRCDAKMSLRERGRWSDREVQDGGKVKAGPDPVSMRKRSCAAGHKMLARAFEVKVFVENDGVTMVE